MEEILQSAYAPQPIKEGIETFSVIQAIRGEAGTIVFGGKEELEPFAFGRGFYSPDRPPSRFFELEFSMWQQKETPHGLLVGVLVPTGVKSSADLSITILSDHSARLVCEGHSYAWKCFSRREKNTLEKRIQTHAVTLYSLPTYRKPWYAVKLNKQIEGINGYLVLTALEHASRASFDDLHAFVLPYDSAEKSVPLVIKSVERVDDVLPAARKITFENGHTLLAVPPFFSETSLLDGKEILNLSGEEAYQLARSGRVPDVPAEPITPFLYLTKNM